MLFTKRESPIKSRTTSVDSGIERVVEDICSRFGVTGKGSSAISAKIDAEAKGSKSSFFGFRVRNNTISSTTSSFQSLPSTTGTSQSSSRSSFDDKAYNSDYCSSFHDYKLTSRQGASRELRATRESSKVSLTSTLSRVEETGDERIVHGASHSVSEVNFRATGENEPKPLISSPFGFQHLSHEGREQFPALRKLSHASSAASLPLKQTSWHATQNAAQAEDRISTGNTFNSVPCEAQTVGSNFFEQAPGSTSTPQHHTSSIQQPIKFSNGMTPPPRSSSKNAVARVNLTNSVLDIEMPNRFDRVDVSDATEGETNMLKRYNSRSHNRHLTRDTIDTSVPRVIDLPHAVTTPDESAVPATSPSYSLDLEDVPEEEEGYFFLGSSRSIIQGPLSESSISSQKSMKSLQSWGSRSTVSDTFSSSCSPARYSLSRKRETSGPTLITSFVPGRAEGLSCQFIDLDCSWEDDIDFCYENAAEADCDFDWQSPSVYETYVGAALHGEVPFGSTICTPQANDTAFNSDFIPRANYDFAIFPTKEPSKQLPITSTFMDNVKLSPKSQCQPLSVNSGIGITSAQSILDEVNNNSNSKLSPNTGKKSPQTTPSRLVFSEDFSCPSSSAATSLNGVSSIEEETTQLALQVPETEKLRSSMLIPKVSKTRLSRYSSFESILQPYSELPTSIRSSDGSFDYVSDMAKSRSNTIT